ncbi:MAG: hypothetical protein QT05_C0005G0005 [archaeon GW2011_AR13]|nr:MAG: hypothetical protein QT05_C0005G0005 [archaeon GW2011_AR13]
MKGTPWFPSTLLEIWKGGISFSLLGYHIECEPAGFLRKFVELNFLGHSKGDTFEVFKLPQIAERWHFSEPS